MKFNRFLSNLFNKYRQFMYGRYGNDELNIALIILGLVISLISNIDKLWFLYFVSIVPLILAICRTLSRNTNARYNEKLKFLNIISGPKTKVISLKNKIRDRKTHKYFNCNKCKATLRLPKGRGKIKITCPKCGNVMIKKT